MSDMFVRTSIAFIETVQYAEMILSALPLCAEDRFLKIAWLSRADAYTGAEYSSFECIMVLICFLFRFPRSGVAPLP